MLTRADRAYVPREALGIMTARSLSNSHPCLLELLHLGQDVLDVGCGPGTLTIETARRVLPGRVVGLDVNPEMLAAAREASPPGALPNLAFLEGDIRDGGWEDEFDLVTAARVLQWIPDAERALTPMVAAVRPGGLVVALATTMRARAGCGHPHRGRASTAPSSTGGPRATSTMPSSGVCPHSSRRRG